MGNEVGSPRRWRLRNGEFDGGQGRLNAGGRTTVLDRSSRAIFLRLLESAGRPVSKTELLEAGWPDIIVHENSLAKAIGRIRTAMGEDSSLLKVVYGVGYQLDADLLAPSRAVQAASVRPGWSRKNLAISPVAAKSGFALAVLAAVGAAVAREGAFSADRPERQFRQTAPIIADAPDAIGKILWVDDHPENNIFEKRFFERHRIAVHPVTTTADALNLLAIYDYKAVISDMGRGEDRLAGARFVQQLRARHDRTPVIIYTVPADEPAKAQAQKELVAESGAQALAVKPEDVRSIVLELFGNPAERHTD